MRPSIVLEPIKCSKALIRHPGYSELELMNFRCSDPGQKYWILILLFSPEMQIGSTVPNMIGTAALQFTAYLAQTALEASIRRRKNKGNSQKKIV